MNPSLDRILADFDPGLPLERARTIPAAWYTSSAVADLERRTVFSTCWQAAGRRELAAEPGSYLTADLAGTPAVVARAEDGVLRAFVNVCRHRAVRVATEPCGRADRLRCRYHGWTYDLAGRLRGVPEFDRVEAFCREEQGLPRLAVAEWGPCVWIHRDPDASALSEYLDPMPSLCAGRGMGQLRWAGRREYDVACNWKVFVDNYLDGGYHINSVHPSLSGVLDYRQYRTDLFPRCSLQSSPLTPPAAGSEGVGAVRVAAGGADETVMYWWVFPNFMLNHYPNGVMDTNLVVPLGPDRCRVVYDFYFPPQDGPEAEAFRRQSMEVSHQVQLEDGAICEEAQGGLRSGAFHAGRYSVRREGPVYHFHRLLADRLRHRPAPEE